MPSTSGKQRGSLAGLFGAAKPPQSALDDKEALAKSLRAGISMPFSVLQPTPNCEESPTEKSIQGQESLDIQNGEHKHALPAPTHQPQPATEAAQAAANREQSQKQIDLPSQPVQSVGVTEEHHARGVSGVGAQVQGEDGTESGSGEEEHLGMVPGAAVGLPVMDYVPISINEMNRAARNSKAEGGGGKKGKQKGDGPQSISQNTLPRKDKDALKRKYIMGLEHEDGEGSEDEEGAQRDKKQRRGQSAQGGSQGGRQGGKQGAGKKRSSHQARVAVDAVVEDSESSSSDDDGDDGDGDDGLRAGSIRNPLTKHIHKAGGRSMGAEPASSDSEDGDTASGRGHGRAGGIVAFDYAAATEQANKVEKARVRRLAQQQIAAGDRGRGRGRQQQQRSAGGRGGKRPAFNPYHIPDENLMKAGKRSTVMPRSGNRTMTFK
ncbi:hypothetical protein DUNSADRAFT_9315 [Dunaliella salina]|uniref:Uncharacterized protein n=1 Tax=Dunaliella salina TaxID=3046 RepID=A0ABQ7GHP4_DUNSA|nr:hypothetical protein DUNSADRAFT_9315 [Dunaliella salina]|eukprot:KAF5834119.1 hypothetical protein DUNSADRAFT_9315 [Dunaliella salina]